MKALEGQGNPQVVNQLLDEKLDAPVTVTPPRFHCRMDDAGRTPSDNEPTSAVSCAERAARRLARRTGARTPGFGCRRSPGASGTGCGVVCFLVCSGSSVHPSRSGSCRWRRRCGPVTALWSRTGRRRACWGIEGARRAQGRALGAAPRNPRHGLVAVHRGRASIAPIARRRARSRSPTPVARSSTCRHGWRTTGCSPRWRARSGATSCTPERCSVRAWTRLRGSGRPGRGAARRSCSRARARTCPRVACSKAKVWLLLQPVAAAAARRASTGSSLPGGRYRLDFAWPEQQARTRSATAGSTMAPRSAFAPDRARSPRWSAAAMAGPAGHLARMHAGAASVSCAG